MVSKTTSNIKVSVIPEYDAKNSFPSENRFVFRYNIIIENNGDFSITLLKRRWIIFDVGFGFTEVIGDGVIGLTPEIKADEGFTYFSNVALNSGIGHMAGVYTVRNEETKEYFEIEIPQFNLYSKVLSN